MIEKYIILTLLRLSLTQAHTPNVCSPATCTRKSVFLDSTTASTRDPPYACRGEELVFNCEVMNGTGIQWASEPGIPCNRPLSYTPSDIDGRKKDRRFYRSYLISIARNPPNSNFTSNLTFTPPGFMNNVTVVCGDQLPFCSSAEAEITLSITDAPVVSEGILRYFISSKKNCPNISVLIQVGEIQNIAPLTYELTVSSSDGCALQECPLLLTPGQRILTVSLRDGVNYTASLVVSNDCGSGGSSISIQPSECEVRTTSPAETPGIRKVEVENASTVAGAAVGCAIVTGVVVALVAVIIFTYWRKKVKMKENSEKELQALEDKRRHQAEQTKYEEELQSLEDEMKEKYEQELQALKNECKKKLQEEQEKSGRDALKLKGADVPQGSPALSGSRDTAPGATGEGASQASFALPASPSEARNSLHMAARQGDLEKVKSLVDKGADIRAKNQDGVTPMHLAAERAHMDIVKYLVRKGADVNIKDDNGRIPLHNAAKGGYERTVECLVKEGAEVNIQDNDGRTPLHTAAGKGYKYTVKWLVKEGADISIKDIDGMTPLHVAAEEGRYKIMGYLVSKGADINVKDNKGWTPLHIAAREGHEHTLKSIVDNGAAIDITNDVGETPLDVAVERGHEKTAEYLRRAGMSEVPSASEVADVHFELVNFTLPELESVPQELPGKPGIKVWKSGDVIHMVVHEDNETMCDLQFIFDKVGDDVMGLKLRRTL